MTISLCRNSAQF